MKAVVPAFTRLAPGSDSGARIEIEDCIEYQRLGSRGGEQIGRYSYVVCNVFSAKHWRADKISALFNTLLELRYGAEKAAVLRIQASEGIRNAAFLGRRALQIPRGLVVHKTCDFISLCIVE